MSEKLVRINVRGVVNLSVADLNAFQEDIKILTDENYAKMKEEILADGFSFSPHIFFDGDGKAWILDGHQRKTCLERMEGEGYEVPLIPCMEVEAEDLEHARRLVLAAASQFGSFRVQKLVEFSKKTGMPSAQLIERFVLPAIRMEKLVDVNAHRRDVGDGAKEVDLGDDEPEHTCPKCKFQFND